MVQGWVAASAGVAQRIQNSSVVSPKQCCAFSVPDSELLCLSCGSVLHERGEGEGAL